MLLFLTVEIALFNIANQENGETQPIDRLNF